MKKLYKAGQKSQAICPDCKAMMPTTYAHRDMTFDEGEALVEDLLVQVCDKCDTPVVIPAQSMPAIKRARIKPKAKPENALMT